MKSRDDKVLRSGSIRLLKDLWELSASKIESLIQSASETLGIAEQRWLTRSKRDLEHVIEVLISNGEYANEENEYIFSELIRNLHHVFKNLYNSLVGNQARLEWVPDTGQSSNPEGWFIDKTFLEVIADGMNLNHYKEVKYGYRPIADIVRYIRNICEHYDELPGGELPLDHITGIRTYGNVYTLVGILILSLYAYIEILQLWVDAN